MVLFKAIMLLEKSGISSILSCMSSPFSIDLIICTYNNASLLHRTLNAITKLKLPPSLHWEILVVNNNSTDQTASVIDYYIKQNNLPLRTVVESKQGLTAARVCGVQNSFGEWIAFIDDDCLLADDWIEQASIFASTHTACGLFGSRISLAFEKEPPAHVFLFPFAYAGKNHGSTPRIMEAVAGAGMVVQRKALNSCGWTEQQFLNDRIGKRLVSGGDMEIALRVGSSYQIWYNPACRLEHIIPERRTSKTYLQRMIFGLGASRHNVNALKWKGPYFTWLLYSIVYSVGLIIMGVLDTFKGWFGKRPNVGLQIPFSPALGWYGAMWAMLLMNPQKRKLLLGCARRKHQ